MARRRRETTPAQHHLTGHEFAVVLPDGAVGFTISGIGDIGTGGPFPYLADAVEQRGGNLPLLLAQQALARPFGESRRFVGADMADRLVGIDILHAFQGEDLAIPAGLFPVQGPGPAALAYAIPTRRQPELGPPVAAILDEGEILRARDRPRGNGKR